MKSKSKVSIAGTAASTAERVFIALIGSVVAITLVVIVLTLNRGFDWSDEAFAYSMISSNRATGDEFWGFHYLLHPVYELFGSSILVFRIFRLLGYVALACVLVLTAKKVLDALNVTLRRSSWVVITLVAQVGTFAAWSYPPRYLAYNELSSWLGQLGIALLILVLVTGREAPTRPAVERRTWLWWALIGVIAALLLVAKITAGLVFIVLGLAVAFIPSVATPMWKRIGASFGGVVAAFGAMIALGIPVGAFASGVWEQLSNSEGREASGYSLSALLNSYLSSASVTVSALGVPILLAACVLVTVRGVQTSDHPNFNGMPYWIERTAVALAAILALMLLLPREQSKWDGLGIAIAFMCCLAVLSLLLIAPRRFGAGAGKLSTLSVSMLVVLFVAAPFVNSVGTNNSIFGQTVFSATMWAVGAAVTLCILWERSRADSRVARFLPVLLLGVVVAGSGLSVAKDVFIHPYNTQPYFKQSTPITVADLRGIQVSEEEAAWFEWLHDVAVREGAEKTPAISVASPGALLAFNASPWAGQWPGPDRQSSIERACNEDRPSDLYVLQRTNDSTEVSSINSGLQECRFSFPDDFAVVDEHVSDDPAYDTTIWRLRPGD